MSSHLKRHSMPKSWPLQRKVITFVSKPNPGSHKRKYVVSVLILLRDILGVAKNTKEAKFIIHTHEILVNGKKVSDIKMPVGIFDVFEIPLTNQKYLVLFNNVGRINLVDYKENNLVLKVVSKQKLKGNKFQISCLNGYTLLVDEKMFNSINVNDSVLYDYASKKIESLYPLKEGNFVYIFDGKYQGKIGKVTGFVSYFGVSKDLIEMDVNGEHHQTAKDYAYVIGLKESDLKRFA